MIVDSFFIAKTILLLAGIFIVYFWLLDGVTNCHMWWDGGSLAQRGYEPIADNIFKCACLFLWACNLFFDFNIPNNLLVASVMIIGITLVLRQLFGWVS